MQTTYANPRNQEWVEQDQDIQIVQNRQIQDRWLLGIDQLEYSNYIQNALYIQKKQNLLNKQLQQGDQSQINSYIQNEIKRIQQVKYTNEEIKQLTTSFSHPYSNQNNDNITLLKSKKMYEMEKIGKKSGSIVRRLLFFENDKIFQLKNSETARPTKRMLEFPQIFILQTCEEYDALPQKEKLQQISWTKSVNKKMARFLFSRSDRPKGFVVYFDLLEDGIILRDYMISIRAKPQFSRFKICLQKISQQICRETAVSFKKQLEQYASQVKKERKRELILKNRFLLNMNEIVMKQFIELYREKAYEENQNQQPSRVSINNSVTDFNNITPHQDRQLQAGNQSKHNIFEDKQQLQQQDQQIYYKQYSSPMKSISQIKPQLDRHARINLVQNNQLLEKYDSLFVNNFIYQWRIMAQEKDTQIQQQKREIHLTFKYIEIDQQLNLTQPVLVIKLKKDQDDKMLRMVNGKYQADGSDGEYFYMTAQCKIKERGEQSCIKWSLTNEDQDQNQQQYQKNNNNNRQRNNSRQLTINQQDLQINISQYSPTDIIQFQLRDQGVSNNQEKAYVTKSLSELYTNEGFGKQAFIDFDFKNISLYQECNVIIMSIDSFLSPSIFPESNSLQNDIDIQITNNLHQIDHIYGDYYILPNLQKKDVKILKNTLDRFKLLLDVDNGHFINNNQNKEINEMKKIQKNLIPHINKITCQSNGQLKKNLELIVALEEDLMLLKESTANSSNIHGRKSSVHPNSNDDDIEGHTLFSLLQLYSDRNILKQHSPQALVKLEKLFKEGLPNYMRTKMWTSISRISEIRFLCQKANHDFSKIKQVYSINQETNPFTVSQYNKDKNHQQSLYDLFLKSSIENVFVVQQQMRENLKEYFEIRKKRTSQQLSFDQLNNILHAYIYWSSIMSKIDSQEISNNIVITYSPSLIPICDKIGLLIFSYNFSDPSNIEQHQQQQQQMRVSEAIEEDVFWTLLSLVYFVFPRYYLFQPNQPQNVIGIKESCQSKCYMPKMYTPQYSSKLVGIKADMMLIKIILRDMNINLLKHFNIIGLPLEHYFQNHMLSAYSEMFHSETLFRLWDLLFFESSMGSEILNKLLKILIFFEFAKYQGHLAYLNASIVFTLLQIASNDLFSCKTPQQIEKVLHFHGYYGIIPNKFIEQVQENKSRIILKHHIYMNLMSNFEDELVNYYNKRIQENIIVDNFANQKSKTHSTIQISQLRQVVETIFNNYGPYRKKSTLLQKAKIIQRDSLQIPNQFDDDQENEKYKLKNNFNLSKAVIAAKQYNPYYNANGSILTSNNRQQLNNISSSQINNHNIFQQQQSNYHSIYQPNIKSSQIDYQTQKNNYPFNSNTPIFNQIATLPKQVSLTKIFLYFHQLKLYWSECSEIMMEVFYMDDQKHEFKIIVDTSVPLSSFFSFEYINNYNKIYIRLFEDDSINKSVGLLGDKISILEAQIDLTAYSPDFVIKTCINLLPNPQHPYNQQRESDSTCVEIDFSVILQSDQIKNQLHQNYLSNDVSNLNQQDSQLFQYPTNYITYFILYGEQSLGIDYSVLLSLFKQDLANTPYNLSLSNSSIDPIFKQSFKRNSKMKFDEVKEIFEKGIQSEEQNSMNNISQIREFYNKYKQLNTNFYLCEALIDLIFHTHSTLSQKLDLVFDLLLSFEGVKKNEERLGLNTVMEFGKYLYNLYLIYIPDHQIYDMIEYCITGQLSSIIKSEIIIKDTSISIDITNELIFLMNIKNLQVKSKDFILGDSDNLKILQSLVNNKFLQTIGNTAYSQFFVDIIYRNEGTLHKYSTLLEKDWTISKKQIFDSILESSYIENKQIQKIMKENQNLLPLNMQRTTITKNEFIKGMSQLPLFQQLVCYQNSIHNKINSVQNLQLSDFSHPMQLNGYFSQIQIIFKVMKNMDEELLKIKFIDSRKELADRNIYEEENYFSYSSRNMKRSILFPNIVSQYIPNQKDYRYKDQLILTKQNLFFEVKNKKRIQKEIKQNKFQRQLTQSQYVNKTVLYLHANPFDSLEEILIQIEILILKEMLNQLDAGYCSLNCLDIENTHIELYLNDGNIMNLLDQSLFKIAHLLPQQEYIYNVIYTYDDSYKLEKEKSIIGLKEMRIIDEQFNQLCKHFYSEYLSDYIPCQIIKKVINNNNQNNNKIKYLLIILKTNPKEYVIKRTKDILMMKKINLSLIPSITLEQLRSTIQLQ